MKKCLVLFLVMLLSACGYHLRGSFDVPNDLKKIYLLGGSAKLREQFNRTLEGSSGQLVKFAHEATVTIRIFEGDIKQRVLSLGQSGRSNEFELYYRLKFDLRDNSNKLLLAGETVEVRRQYFNDQQDLIAKDNEEGVIRDEMYQQAVRTILNRARSTLENPAKTQ